MREKGRLRGSGKSDVRREAVEENGFRHLLPPYPSQGNGIPSFYLLFSEGEELRALVLIARLVGVFLQASSVA